MTDITAEDIVTKKLLIRQYVVETDIHPFVKGTTFEKVWENKIESVLDNTMVFFASLDDLIEMKRSAGRTKDLEDLKYLVKLKDRLCKKKDE